MVGRATCPVVSGYLSKTRSFIDFSRPLFQDFQREFDTLEELAENTYSHSLVQQHQRAFLCVELIVARYIVARVGPRTDFSLMDWSRSREGLNALLRELQRLNDDITGETMESDLVGVNRANADQVRLDQRRSVLSTIEVAVFAAETVRVSLKNPNTRLGVVGGALATVVDQRRAGPWEALWLGRTLIAQTEREAYRGWQVQKE